MGSGLATPEKAAGLLVLPKDDPLTAKIQEIINAQYNRIINDGKFDASVVEEQFRQLAKYFEDRKGKCKIALQDTSTLEFVRASAQELRDSFLSTYDLQFKRHIETDKDLHIWTTKATIVIAELEKKYAPEKVVVHAIHALSPPPILASHQPHVFITRYTQNTQWQRGMQSANSVPLLYQSAIGILKQYHDFMRGLAEATGAIAFMGTSKYNEIPMKKPFRIGEKMNMRLQVGMLLFYAVPVCS